MSATVGAVSPADHVEDVRLEVPEEWDRIAFASRAVKRVIEFARFRRRLAKTPAIAFMARSLGISQRTARRWYANEKHTRTMPEWRAMRRHYALHLGEEVSFLPERAAQPTRESNEPHADGGSL